MLVDRDNFDDALDGMHPELRLPGIHLEFSELDDFHPDHIYAETGTFQKFAEERQRPLPVAPKRAETRKPDHAGGSLLDTMLDESGEESAPGLEEGGDLASFLKKVTAPHLVPRENPRQKEQAERVDSSAAAAMRGILHHPDFQALEAAWRAVLMLVRGLDTDEDLKVYICDATLDELAADPAGTEKLFHNGERAWALIAANYVFRQTPAYAKLLGSLGRMARSAGAPIVAEATPPSDESPEWHALRQTPEAHWIGLALPRFLLRLPYGRKTSPVESFEFEEMPESIHQNYLWGNPAFCCAYLLGQTFLTDGWEMRPGTHRQIDGIPLHVYSEGGESHMKPCAEVLMTEKDAGVLMAEGIMPLATMKDQDAVLLVRFQSIAKPVAALSGPWTA